MRVADGDGGVAVPDKERERQYLQSLGECLPELPLGEVSSPEPPDFVIASGGVRLGIEFTKFVLPIPDGQRPGREVGRLQERVVTRARQLHEAEGGPPLHVHVDFGPWDSLRKTKVGNNARKLADLVRSVVGTGPVQEHHVDVPIEAVPTPFGGIRIYSSFDAKDSYWSVNSSAWVADVSPDDVRVQISRKTPMAKAARKTCEELWLVIVNDTFDHGEPVSISASALSHEYNHPFDRVYWLDLVPKRATELLGADRDVSASHP